MVTVVESVGVGMGKVPLEQEVEKLPLWYQEGS